MLIFRPRWKINLFLFLLPVFLWAQEEPINELLEKSTPVIEEEIEDWVENYQGPALEFIYDREFDHEYSRVVVEGESVSEYHYLKDIRFANLYGIFSKILRQIVLGEGYRYLSKFTFVERQNPHPSLMYHENSLSQTASGSLNLPQFSIEITGRRRPDPEHSYDIVSEGQAGWDRMVFNFIGLFGTGVQTYGTDVPSLFRKN
jgi:hypothetical protein